MSGILKSRRFWYLTVCWISRILAGLLATLLLTIIICEGSQSGLPNPFTQPLPVAIELFAILCAVFGLLIGMRWFGIGGILVIAGATVFYVIEHQILMDWGFEVFELIGILYLVGWWLKKDVKAQKNNIIHGIINTTILIITIGIAIIAGVVFSNPLRWSDEHIRNRFLQKTPLGTQFTDVKKYIEKAGWKISVIDTEKSLSISGHYQDIPFRADVTVFWRFDKDLRLIDICIDKSWLGI